MYFLDSEDNRIITSSLECLQVLFKLMPFKFSQFLQTTGSMQQSFLNKKIQINNNYQVQASNLNNQDSLLLLSSMNLTSLDLNNDYSNNEQHFENVQ